MAFLRPHFPKFLTHLWQGSTDLCHLLQMTLTILKPLFPPD